MTTALVTVGPGTAIGRDVYWPDRCRRRLHTENLTTLRVQTES